MYFDIEPKIMKRGDFMLVKQTILPQLTIIDNKFDSIHTYTLLINGEYEFTYNTKQGIYNRIVMLMDNELKRFLNEK